MRSFSKLGWLGALYFVQGLPFGLQATFLPVYLRERGVSVTSIGFLGVLALPWLLKALWAPLVDRYGSPCIGRRKSWILPLQAALALSSAGAAFVEVPEQLHVLLGLVFLLNLLAATQDIAVDGLAVDLLSDSELGPGNAAQVVGYKLGMLSGGGLLLWLTQYLGFGAVFGGMALACSIVFVVTLLVFIASYKLGEAMSDVAYKPFLVDAGVRPAQIGLWVGTYGGVASVLGSLSGGLLTLRWSVLHVFLLGLALSAAFLALLPLVSSARSRESAR